MLSIRILCLSAATLVAVFSTVCFAQTKAQSAWTSSTTTQVKPEKQQEFEGYLKRIVAAYKKAGIPWFVTIQNFAGNTTEYTTVVPVMKFADLMGPSVVVKVLGEEGWGVLSRNMADCYTAETRQYAVPQTELEINKANVPEGGYWVETRTLVAQGKLDDYLYWLKNDYRPALEKAGVSHFQVSRPIFGAIAGEVVLMRMLKNLADIDEGPILIQALGAEGARVVDAKSVGLVGSSHTKIVRVRTDLTYSPGN